MTPSQSIRPLAGERGQKLAAADFSDAPPAPRSWLASDTVADLRYTLAIMTETIVPLSPDLTAFHALTASRRAWIADFLVPWCRTANVPSLLKAELEWGDIAGRVDPQFSLWLWAWSRFPVLYVDGLRGLEESFLVQVTLHSGSLHVGYPDSRASQRSLLVLVDREHGQTVERGPFRLDQVQAVERVEDAGA